ncbi:MAG: carboxypeptidase-like regulatory domain-containing protein [Gemmatimonadales bacterium]|nr:carboxypeptidase-like regulatory domain-containing protein [Gemmatimonadales bacterium]
MSVLTPARVGWIAVCCVVALWWEPVHGQAVLTGRVAGGTPIGPLLGALVEIRGLELGAITDSTGQFRIDGIRPGQHEVLVRRIGYRPLRQRIRFGADEVVRVGFRLEEIPIVLDSVTVRADDLTWPNPMMAGFEQRLKLGLGRFLDHYQLMEKEGQSLESTLRELGVPIEYGRRGAYAAESRGSSSMQQRTCPARVILDGALLNWTRDTLYLRDLPPVRLVAGVEYYRGSAQIPLMFQTDGGMCGVLVIWTRLR